MSARVLRIDPVTLLRRDAAEVTAEGFRRYDALFSRTGIQIYGDGKGGTIREYRPPDEVFAEDSLASFELVPVTLGHPPVNLTTETARVFARGAASRGRRHSDGRHVAGRMNVWDHEAITEVDGGVTQLSGGYTLELDLTSGVTPDGEHYDAIQRKIRLNHVAIVAAGRAGTAEILADSADAWDLASASALADVVAHRNRVTVDLGRWARADSADLRIHQSTGDRRTMKTIKIKLDGDEVIEIEVADAATPQQIADVTAKAVAAWSTSAAKALAEQAAADKASAEQLLSEAQDQAPPAANPLLPLRIGQAIGLIGVTYSHRADGKDKTPDEIALDVIEHVSGEDARKRLESYDEAVRAGAIQLALDQALEAHEAAQRGDHVAETIAAINNSRKAAAGKRSDAGEECDYEKERKAKADELAKPAHLRSSQKAS